MWGDVPDDVAVAVIGSHSRANLTHFSTWLCYKQINLLAEDMVMGRSQNDIEQEAQEYLEEIVDQGRLGIGDPEAVISREALLFLVGVLADDPDFKIIIKHDPK